MNGLMSHIAPSLQLAQCSGMSEVGVDRTWPANSKNVEIDPNAT
jgi:hypothetical protein